MRLWKLGLVLGCAAVVGCSSSSSPSGTGGSDSGGGGGGGSGTTCDYSSNKSEPYCETYENLPSADDSTIAEECKAAGGKTGTTCSTSNVVGCCTVSEGSGSTGYKYESCYYSPFTATEAKAACTSGTFSSKP